MRWKYVPVEEERKEALSRELGVSAHMAEVLARLDIERIEDLRAFLNPKLRDLGDPFDLPNLKEAAQRIIRARDAGERVVVFGDYDVDGVTSTTLLVSVFRSIGLRPDFIVPRRMEEGYGLSAAAAERVVADCRPDLVLAVDCGTNSQTEVKALRERGIDVIIVDHHRAGEGVCEDCLIVNPHLETGEARPWTELSAVGLAFKLAHGLLKCLRESGDSRGWDIELKDYLDLAALGTIADLVPLREENRILAWYGLKALNEARGQGLRALVQVAGLKEDAPIRPVDIAFRLGPRINACGRLADATLPVRMFLSEDFGFCLETANQLDAYNRERQDIERRIVAEADERIEAMDDDLSGMVLYDDQWHPGVVGIVASRLSRKYNRPAIVLGREGDLAKGSGRGIPGLNLVRVLERCDDLLDSWGGHPLAVGVALPRRNVKEFQKRFSSTVRDLFDGEIPLPEIDIAAWIDLDDIDESFLGELDRLHPFGQGNPEPLFGVRQARLRAPPRVFQDAHYRFQVESRRRRRFFGVAWKKADSLPPLNTPLDFIFRIYRNLYNGREYLQLELIDWRHAREPESP